LNNMGLLRLILFILLCFGYFSNCSANGKNELTMLLVKEPQIYKFLNDIIKEEDEHSNLQKSTLILKIENVENSFEIRAGMLYEENISSYLSEKSDKAIGFFEYKGVVVIVFGEDISTFFEKTNKNKSFSFLEERPKFKTKEGQPPPPPVIYEPIVWIYLYRDGKFELTDKGRFTLLK
jgi:hypothetical protein